MDDGTTLLLGLEGVRVRRVERLVDGARRVHVQTEDEDASACPDCGVFSTSVKAYVCTRPKDLPYGKDPVELCWHKRRWRCREEACDRGSFTEQIAQVPVRARTTRRLLASCADGVCENRSIDEVARAHRLSWPTVQRAVDARAAELLGEPPQVAVLGIDETRFGSPRWSRDPESGKWRRSDPWETGFVDLEGNSSLLGQVKGRSSSAVIGWLDTRGEDWKNAVQIVAIDPSAPYRNAVRQALPHARLVVDHFHLVRLANQALTKVRQRVTRQQLGRRGRKIDPAWANRRLLLMGRQRLSQKAFAKLWNACMDTDPSNQILAAWIAKEELRSLLALAGAERHVIHRQLWRYYTWCANLNIPEITTLAETIESWWPEIEAFLQLGVTNAGTEGTNRLIKQVKRTACGFRNNTHYRHRVRLHCIHNRQRMSAQIRRLPAQD